MSTPSHKDISCNVSDMTNESIVFFNSGLYHTKGARMVMRDAVVEGSGLIMTIWDCLTCT